MTSAGEVTAWATERAPGDPVAPPPSQLAGQRAGEPIQRVRIWDGSEPWMIGSYAHYRQVLGDQSFSADKSRPGFPLKNAGYVSKKKTFLTMDDPEHLPYRRLFAKHFSAPRMELLRAGIQRIVDANIDRMLASTRPVDFIETFALRVPIEVLGELFGVPEADRGTFLDLALTMSSGDSTPEQTAAAIASLNDYADRLIRAREDEPRDDLITRLLHDGVHGGVMGRDELVDEVTLLIGAAHDTSLALIALGTLALLNHPEQLRLLIDNSDDPAFVATATEELLRYVSPTQTGRRRIATADVEVGGTLIRKGEGVIALDSVSSRDPAVFANPDVLDLRRAEARRHNAFGFGTHQCAGQSLARVELQVVFATLYRRIPTLRLAVPQAELPFREDTIVYIVDAMPVTW